MNCESEVFYTAIGVAVAMFIIFVASFLWALCVVGRDAPSVDLDIDTWSDEFLLSEFYKTTKECPLDETEFNKWFNAKFTGWNTLKIYSFYEEKKCDWGRLNQ